MRTTLSAALGEQKKQSDFTVSWKSGYGSSDWNWRQTKHGSCRSVAIAKERRASSFWVSSFAGGVNRKGHAWLKRRTARKKLRNSLKRVTEWCRQNRHRNVREQVQLLNARLRGYKNYYGVSGNSTSLDEFFDHVRRIHQRWLNQRSQRRSYTWAAYNELMGLLRLEQPRIVPAAKQSL